MHAVHTFVHVHIHVRTNQYLYMYINVHLVHDMLYIHGIYISYSGTTKIYGAYTLHPMIESELADITKHRHERSIMDNVHQSSGKI